MEGSNKRIKWEARSKNWKTSGLSIAKWCKENGFKDHQMYYWVKKIDGNQLHPKISQKFSDAVFLPVDLTNIIKQSKMYILILTFITG